MRTLLSFLLTAFAFAAIAPAEAEAQRKRGKQKVVIHVDDDFRVDEDYGDERYHRREPRRHTLDRRFGHRHGHLRAALIDDRQDLREIREIVYDWKRAVRFGDYHAERRADRRLRRWLSDELLEPTFDRRDAHRTHRIAERLRAMQPAFRRGYAGPYMYAKKRRLLNRLVRISERELIQTRQVAASRGVPPGFAYAVR